MNKSRKIFSTIQVLIIICLMLCNRGTWINSSQKTRESLCKDLQCGCKLVSDCKKYCCCTFTGEQNTPRTSNGQKDVFQIFMSSINCKYGNDPLNSITFTSKYILEDQVQFTRKTFLCFLSQATLIYPPEVFIFPPKKPPRYFL